MAAAAPAQPPAAIPEGQVADVGKLSKPLSVLLVSKQIPWIIQEEMGRQRHTTVDDLADR